MTARRRLRRLQHDEIGLQIAPMIDVTLLLLFFFMLSGRLSQGTRWRAIDLPKLTGQTQTHPSGGLEVLNVGADGGVFVGEHFMQPNELALHLRKRFQQSPSLTLHLRADAATPASKIKEIVQMAAGAGAAEIVYGVRP